MSEETAKVIKMFAETSYPQLRAISKEYQTKTNKTLEETIIEIFSGNYQELLLKICEIVCLKLLIHFN